MRRFEGRAILLTGAGSGIGKATAERLGAEGGRVLCLDLNEAAVEATAAEIRKQGGEAVARVCDVASEDSVKAAVAAALEHFGRLDVVANVAGVGGFVRTTDVSLADWNRVIGINLTGTFLVCRESIPHILESRGAIVNVASVAGVKSHPYAAAYCASKGGVVMLTRALAAEYGRKEVRINCVCPGGVETPMIQHFQLPSGVNPSALMRISPLGRMGRPAEIAGTIAFLASEDAAYINGAAIVVDGGMTT